MQDDCQIASIVTISQPRPEAALVERRYPVVACCEVFAHHCFKYTLGGQSRSCNTVMRLDHRLCIDGWAKHRFVQPTSFLRSNVKVTLDLITAVLLVVITGVFAMLDVLVESLL